MNWEPIETMPDGELESFLVKNDIGQVAPMIRGIIHNNVGTPWDWDFGRPATHWMPFPAP